MGHKHIFYESSVWSADIIQLSLSSEERGGALSSQLSHAMTIPRDIPIWIQFFTEMDNLGRCEATAWLIFPVTECQSQSRAQAAAEHRGEYFTFNVVSST